MDVILLGISKDTLKSHDKFITEFGLPFTLLSDPDAVMMRAYGAYGEKVQCGKKTLGTIRSTVVIGQDGKVMKHWPKVAKAESHPRQVLEFLQKK
jgi:peroxiredoxin Q/BCP